MKSNVYSLLTTPYIMGFPTSSLQNIPVLTTFNTHRSSLKSSSWIWLQNFPLHRKLFPECFDSWLRYHYLREAFAKPTCDSQHLWANKYGQKKYSVDTPWHITAYTMRFFFSFSVLGERLQEWRAGTRGGDNNWDWSAWCEIHTERIKRWYFLKECGALVPPICLRLNWRILD